MKEYKMWLTIENLIPIKFYPYTSGVDYRILAQNHNYKTEEHDFLEELGNKLHDIVVSTGINWDNKVVVECLVKSATPNETFAHVFIGKYDGRWSVGLSCWSDPWIKPAEINL
jgi:hypothetical protein